MVLKLFNFLFVKVLLLLICSAAFAQEFISPVGNKETLSVDKDPAKYYLMKPGSELVFKISGPTTIKIYGRILNPAKSGNASLLVKQGDLLVGAMLITPKVSTDLLKKEMSSLSHVTVQEFNISEGEHQIKIKSSPKSPEVIVAVEVMGKKVAEQSIDLIPLVPLVPLVPPKTGEKGEGIDLIPLVPLAPTETKSAKKEESIQPAAPPKEKKEEHYREISARSTDIPSEKSTPGVTTVVEVAPTSEVGERHFSVYTDVGIIVPLQSIGGPYPNAEILFGFYPVRSNRAFGIGVKAGFHYLSIDIKDGTGNLMYTMGANIVPLSLLLSYSVPISSTIISDLSFGGGISLVSAEISGEGNNLSRSDSSLPFSFEVGGAISYKIDRNNSIGGRVGFLGGRTSMDFVSDLDIGGLILSLGYSFTF